MHITMNLVARLAHMVLELGINVGAHIAMSLFVRLAQVLVDMRMNIDYGSEASSNNEYGSSHIGSIDATGNTSGQ